MPLQKVDPETADREMFALFCSYGYDGTSLEMLANATGLKKASLYHRFPEGKKEMALHVLKGTRQWIKTHIRDVLTHEEQPVKKRLTLALQALDQLYNGGSSNCILRTLSIGTDAPYFRDAIASCFELLHTGFAAIAAANGFSGTRALQQAKEVSVAIQGSLVLSNVMNDTTYFKKCLEDIPLLLKK
ncbi:TetR/AcrR family transcriptional regulator [Chitinophaga solisilvae]|uniref:TetR/AcrR family transcriptional regulator n=1 Tax=Chitinophaga solisilvae TaxID=1233460 RepID=A0A433WKB8_9BACT|nr:TetR/AcrR family transcriptional regulator [Chitinophaga solisilvae]NSL85953.1 TetR/AcrR family transcriptional regulator [Chitinophaga solisilvae]